MKSREGCQWAHGIEEKGKNTPFFSSLSEARKTLEGGPQKQSQRSHKSLQADAHLLQLSSGARDKAADLLASLTSRLEPGFLLGWRGLLAAAF